jgi:drug/metabolite transporter (DMT)-like permease
MSSTISIRARRALGSLGSAAWWTEVAEGAWRQFLQVALPYLVVIAASGVVTRGAAWAIASAAVTGTLTVVLGRISGLKPDPVDSGATQAVYRVLSAVAASLLTFLPVDLGQLLDVNWVAAVLAALASGALALVHGVLDAPASVVRGEVLAVSDYPHASES